MTHEIAREIEKDCLAENQHGLDASAVNADVIQPMFSAFTIVRHLKTGGKYLVVGTPDKIRLKATNQPAYAYQKYGDNTAPIWILCQTEMEDGRFVPAV